MYSPRPPPFPLAHTHSFHPLVSQICIKQHSLTTTPSDGHEVCYVTSDSETLDDPAHENSYWPSEPSDHDVSDIEEISTRLPEELARLHALAPRLIPSKLLDTTIQGPTQTDKIIRKSLRNSQGPGRRAENKCLTEICSECRQWLCGDCLPGCTCEEIGEPCEEGCERVAETEETEVTEVTSGIEETGGTEVEEMEGTQETQGACQVHCGTHPLLFPS